MKFRLFVLVTLFAFVAAAQSKDRPNVLMISIDDLNDWTGFQGGHPQAITPHMDALAARSRVFTNAHCAVPVCTSSRVSIMSGTAATTHGSYEIGPKYE
ncbi:MAG: sulfatase-like hydrolase/transferase, partial [Verrucomicrobiota bacterium]